MRYLAIYLSIFLLTLVTACSSEQPPAPPGEKQLNITIFLDLSDRINPTKNSYLIPSQVDRDIQNVMSIVRVFKEDMIATNALAAKQQIRVVFHPTPRDPEIDQIGRDLSFDLSIIPPGEARKKKDIFDQIESVFETNLHRVYTSTIEKNEYPGSDIWGFFKSPSFKDIVVADTSVYKNILVVITDGYLYHKDSYQNSGLRTSALVPQYFNDNGFRSPQWADKVEAQDYGLLTERTDLTDLSVLFLGLEPYKGQRYDGDIMIHFLYKWLQEMGISQDRSRILLNELPSTLERSIQAFIKN